jgi:hypothetical protein
MGEKYLLCLWILVKKKTIEFRSVKFERSFTFYSSDVIIKRMRIIFLIHKIIYLPIPNKPP